MTKIFAQFCDDIRQEVGGKTTLVGLYNEVIIADALPCILAKFCVYLTIYSNNMNLEIPIEIDSEGDVIFSGEGKFEIHKNEWSGIDMEHKASLPLMFSPIVLQNEGVFTVRANIAGKWIVAGQIAVQKVKVKSKNVSKNTLSKKSKKTKK